MIRDRLSKSKELNSISSLECDISIGKGEKGDAFTFEDFSPEQLESLRGEKGDMGEAFKYEDFTPEQLESLRGEKGEKGDVGDRGDKGEKGDAFTFEDFTQDQLDALKGDKGEKGDSGDKIELNKSNTHIQYKHEGESEWIDLVALDDLKTEESVINSLLDQIQTLTERVLALEESTPKPPNPMDAPTFLGLITPFKDIKDISYEDLNVDTVNQNSVIKPQSIYKHSAGTQFNRSCIIAIPKVFGSIVGVVDGADITITGAYHWTETALDIPNIGAVEYIVGGNIKPQAYNNSSVVKWNLE